MIGYLDDFVKSAAIGNGYINMMHLEAFPQTIQYELN